MDGAPSGRNKAAFSNSSGLKSAFEKLLTCDGQVWTVRPAVEIRLRSQTPPTEFGQGVRK